MINVLKDLDAIIGLSVILVGLFLFSAVLLKAEMPFHALLISVGSCIGLSLAGFLLFTERYEKIKSN